MSRSAISEVELARTVVAWLQDWGWTVYKEVQVFAAGRRADIIAVLRPKVWVIETKTSYGLGVLEQAMYWRQFAHYVSVATPRPRRPRTHEGSLCSTLHDITGLGLLWAEYGVQTVFAPQVRPRVDTHWIHNVLRPEHQLAEAGSNRGGYYTPFASTKQRFIDTVRANPGHTMKELIDYMGRCHYCSENTARTALAAWVRRGVIEGVERRQEGRNIHYYPVDVRLRVREEVMPMVPK